MLPSCGAHPRHHLEQVPERPHAAHLLHLVEEVVERELLLADLALELLRLALVHLALGLLDERHDVAHAEYPLGHPIGVEALEVRQLLARRGEQDRLARDGLDRQRRAAAGVAVQLREHDAVEARHLSEGLGDVDGVLTGHRVDDEQHVVRLGALLDLGELLHQVLVHVQTPARVDDQDVAAVLLGLVERPFGDVDGIAAGALLVHVRARLAPDLDELIDGRGPIDVAGGDGHVHVLLLAQVARELAAGGRLARALQPGHQDHGGPRPSERELAPRPTHQRGELVRDDLHDLLAGIERLQHVLAESPAP